MSALLLTTHQSFSNSTLSLFCLSLLMFHFTFLSLLWRNLLPKMLMISMGEIEEGNFCFLLLGYVEALRCCIETSPDFNYVLMFLHLNVDFTLCSKRHVKIEGIEDNVIILSCRLDYWSQPQNR